MAKRKKAAPKARKAKPKAAGTSQAKRPDGSVSAGIYDAVEKLIAGGAMKRAAAFRQIAKEQGRKEGTVAVNYYYAAKKRGGAKRARRGPGRSKGITVSRNGAAGSSRIETVLRSLADLVRAQEAEIASLRRDNERFGALRRLLAS